MGLGIVGGGIGGGLRAISLAPKRPIASSLAPKIRPCTFIFFFVFKYWIFYFLFLLQFDVKNEYIIENRALHFTRANRINFYSHFCSIPLIFAKKRVQNTFITNTIIYYYKYANIGMIFSLFLNTSRSVRKIIIIRLHACINALLSLNGLIMLALLLS